MTQHPPAPYAPAGPPQYWAPAKQRSTGTCILLYLVTFGIYGYFWVFSVHDEMKRRNGDGLGGPIALVLWFCTGLLAMAFLTPWEVGRLYEREGRRPPVTVWTGLWGTLGILLFGVGPIVWFVKTNGALNEYWRSQGLH